MAEVVGVAEIEEIVRREIRVTVTGPDILPWVRYTGAAPFLPERVWIQYERIGDEIEEPRVSMTGPRLRKDGSRGAVESTDRWVRPSEYPEWLAVLVETYRPAW